MATVRDILERHAAELAPLCQHISVRNDEDGPFIFAIGLKGVHSLEIKPRSGLYIVELWHGATSEEERVIGEPSFGDPDAATAEARAWLGRDAEPP